MPFELYLAFMAACVVLVIIPGPNVALIVANSFAHGPRYALMTVAGTSSAIIVQLALVIAGLTTMLHAMSGVFLVCKWLGVAYLIWLGVRYWRAAPPDLNAQADRAARRYRDVFAQGFLISLTNPKTLVFYAAFFPQFMHPAMPALPQFLLLGMTFLLIATVSDSGYAMLAGRIRPWLQGSRVAAWQNRVTGTLMLLCAAGLVLTRRSS